jgi:hypothetical protein
MGLKQMIERSFSLLRASLRSVRQRFFSLLSPSSDELVPSGPQRLLGPWEQGWALDLHSRFLNETWQCSEVGRLVRKYKYCGRIDLADRLADRILALMEQHPDLKAIDAIVPVPPSTERLYDPVSLLGQVLARRLGVPLLNGALRKTRTTTRQKGMRTRAHKRANVAGAFAVQSNVRGKSLLVLDDLYDSGETLKEVTRVLKRAGARSVKVLTLTRTRYYERTALGSTQ